MLGRGGEAADDGMSFLKDMEGTLPWLEMIRPFKIV